MVRVFKFKDARGVEMFLLRDDRLNFYLGDKGQYRRISDGVADKIAKKHYGIRNIMEVRRRLTQTDYDLTQWKL